MRKREMDAPDYFEKTSQLVDDIDEEIADLLGVGEGWMEHNKEKPGRGLGEGLNIDQVVRQRYEDGEIEEKVFQQLRITWAYRQTLIDTTWGKFRYRHKDGEWGISDVLVYDPEEDVIYQEKSIQKEIEKIWEKVQGFINNFIDVKGP